MPVIDFFAISTHHLGLVPYGTITHHEAIDEPSGRQYTDQEYEQDFVLKTPGGANYVTFGWTNTIPVGSTINAVSITCCIWLHPLSAPSGQAAVLEIGDQAYYQFSLPGNGWTPTTKTWTTNPAGGAWTYSALSNLYFGVYLSTPSDETEQVLPSKCTQCYLTIDYTPPATTFRAHGCVC